MSDGKYINNKGSILKNTELLRNINIGVVISIDDPNSLGRIKVRIPGKSITGGDDEIIDDELPWAFPMLPKFFSAQPKVGEGVFVQIISKGKTHSDRLYFGPIISELTNLNVDRINSTALNAFTFGLSRPVPSFKTIPSLNGIFPKDDDVTIQGRYNTDIIQRKNQILIRAGKFVEVTSTTESPYKIEFNTQTPAFIQMKNNVKLVNDENFSVTNIVANKINLLTHKDGSPRYNLTNQNDQISDTEILNILETAHPLPFGDYLLDYLKLLKNALLNHVHNYHGLPPTDLTIGETLPVSEFVKKSNDLEAKLLSKNIRIN